VGSAQGASQRLSGRRNRDQVNVVGHQAPSQHAQSVMSGMFRKDFQIAPPVKRGKENVFAVVTFPLGDVVGEPRSYESRSTRHAQ